MTKKLYVRFATTQDEKAVFDFYKENEHNFVFKREPQIWKDRIAAGSVTIIEDEAGKLVASSISYPITGKNEKGEEVHMWTEIGSTRVALSGLGLFNPLVTAQVMRSYLLEPPKERYVLEIVLGNDHSKHVFTKLGSTLYEMPESLSQKIRGNIKPESAGAPVEWFQIGTEAIPSIAAKFVDLEKNNKLVSKETGEEYELDYSRCVIATQFQKEIEQLAKQNFGDVKKPDYKKPLKPVPARATI